MIASSFPSPRHTGPCRVARSMMDIPSALQALAQGSALLSQPERRALAAVLRTLAEELNTDSDVAALTTGVALASIEEPPWQLPQPHSEAMPWLLLCGMVALCGCGSCHGGSSIEASATPVVSAASSEVATRKGMAQSSNLVATWSAGMAQRHGAKAWRTKLLLCQWWLLGPED